MSGGGARRVEGSPASAAPVSFCLSAKKNLDEDIDGVDVIFIVTVLRIRYVESSSNLCRTSTAGLTITGRVSD